MHALSQCVSTAWHRGQGHLGQKGLTQSLAFLTLLSKAETAPDVTNLEGTLEPRGDHPRGDSRLTLFPYRKGLIFILFDGRT